MRIFTQLLWIFMLCSFAGWLLKFTWYSILERKPMNPGFIILPFIPASGIGAAAIFLVTHPITNNWMIFLGSAILLTVGKYVASYMFEKTLGFKWRDYSRRPLNLNGYVTLFETVTYGLMALFFKHFGFIWIERLIDTMPLWVALMVALIVTGLIIFDTIVSIITVIHLRRNLKQMNDISHLIKENDGEKSGEELRAEYEQKMLTSKRFRQRLVRAFPDMKSLDYEKQLLDLKERFNIIKAKNNEVYEKKITNNEDRPFAYGLSLVKLFWLFFLGSLFGTMMETVWALFAEGHFEVRTGMVMGPFIPVYGGGAVAITLVLYKLHKANDLIIYLASAVIGATFEYFCSYFQEKVLGTISWDYSDMPFNIDGRTSLMFALIWGLLGLFWLRYVYPVFSRLIEKIPKKPGRIITAVLVVFMAINGLLTIAAIQRQTQRSHGVEAGNAFVQWIDDTFPDDYMEFIFPHMEEKK